MSHTRRQVGTVLYHKAPEKTAVLENFGLQTGSDHELGRLLVVSWKIRKIVKKEGFVPRVRGE